MVENHHREQTNAIQAVLSIMFRPVTIKGYNGSFLV